MKILSYIIFLGAVGVGTLFFRDIQIKNIYPGANAKLEESVLNTNGNVIVKYKKLNNKSIKTIFIKGDIEKPLIVFFHGNYELIDDSVELFKNVAKNTGFNTVMIEYNGYGESEGSPNLKDTSKSVNEWLETEYINKYSKTKEEQDFIIWGKSIGSAHALHFSKSYPKLVDHIVIQSGFMSPINAITDHKIFKPLLTKMLFWDFEADWKIEMIAKKSKLKSALVIHGDKDQLFHINIAKEIRDTFIENDIETEYIELDGGHNNLTFNFNEFKIFKGKI